jgi:hypothetical protein
VICIALLLSSCATPAPTEAVHAPTPKEVSPTEVISQPAITSMPTAKPPVATPFPDLPSTEVSIPASENNESIKAFVTGNGSIPVIIVPNAEDDISTWKPLVNALASNEKLKVVIFSYRDYLSTMGKDTIAVYGYLQAQGASTIIPVCAGVGTRPCVIDLLKNGSEIKGMVLMDMDTGPVNTSFPKFFITGDGNDYSGVTKQDYEHSDEPKTLKVYPPGVNGSALFSYPDVGPQVLKDITEFVNGIANGQ